MNSILLKGPGLNTYINLYKLPSRAVQVKVVMPAVLLRLRLDTGAGPYGLPLGLPVEIPVEILTCRSRLPVATGP